MATKTIYLPGSGKLLLNDSDHLATGGEGAVYLKNGQAFKLYLDPAKARAMGLEDKIGLLTTLKHPAIVAPLGPVYDLKQDFIGYRMPEAKGVPLMTVFTTRWRDEHGFGDREAMELVANMREAVAAVHTLGALLVDGNEFNYLAQGTQPRLLDVDSWQIGRFTATAQMPSIRDYHQTGFTPESDWFAWAVVSFQVFTGIHPYKGTHPDFKKGDLSARMQANASVFDSRVRLNAAVRDFSAIPANLRNWYEGVFQHGARGVPPSPHAGTGTSVGPRQLRRVSHPGGVVKHEHVLGFSGPIRHISAIGVAFYQDEHGWHAYDVLRQQALSALSTTQVETLFSNQSALVRGQDHFVLLENKGDILEAQLVAGDRDPQPRAAAPARLPCRATKLVVFGNRVFALNNQNELGLSELDLTVLGGRLLLSVRSAWPILGQSTRFMDGFALMDALGTPFLVIPDDQGMVVRRAADLRDYRVIAGYARGADYLLVHAQSRQDGQLYRLSLDASQDPLRLLDRQAIDDPDLNAAQNARGVVVSFPAEGILSVSHRCSGTERRLQDNSLNNNLRLFALNDGIYYTLGADIYRLRLS